MGEIAGAHGRPVARPDPARGRELPDQRDDARAGADRRDRPRSRRPPPRRSTPSSASSTPDQADAIATAADEIVGGRARRRLPDRRLPDRLGHQLQHEHQRGDRLARRPRPASTSTPTTTSTPASRATTPSRPSIHVAAVAATARPASRRSTTSRRRWRRKAEEFKDVVKSGRTHLMDATPVMLGQEFGGYAAIVRLGIERLESTLPRVARAAPRRHGGRHRHQHPRPGSPQRVIADLADETGLPFTEARNHFEAQGDPDALVELSGQLRTDRRRPHQDLQRPALDVVRPDDRAGRDPPARPAARARASCPARSTRCSPRPR